MTVDVNDVLEAMKLELDLDDGDIAADSTMQDVEFWDSLGHLRVCMALEAKFAVKIPMEAVGDLVSVPAIVAFLAES